MSLRIIATLVLLSVLTVGSAAMVSSQDVDDATRQQQAREAAQQRAREQAAAKEAQAQRDWLKRSADQSDANLNRMIDIVARQKSNENEVKFQALQNSSQELLDLSVKTFNRIHSSGAQSVSVTLFSDLDRMEKLIKEIRKNAR